MSAMFFCFQACFPKDLFWMFFFSKSLLQTRNNLSLGGPRVGNEGMLGGGFKYFYFHHFSSLLGEMIQFD